MQALLARCRVPIMMAPMAGVCTSSMVSEACNNGVVGSVGVGHMRSSLLIKMLREIDDRRRAAADSSPLNVNFFSASSLSDMNDQVRASVRDRSLRVAERLESLNLAPKLTLAQIDAALDAAARDSERLDKQLHAMFEVCVPEILSCTFGTLPRWAVERVLDSGGVACGTATSAREALELVERHSFNAVTAQGFEAGGHRGTFLGERASVSSMLGTASLVPRVVNALHGTGAAVLAAGGIVDARGVRAALALGAVGAQMGTAFVACDESGASEAHKRALAAAAAASPQDVAASETVLTATYTGRLVRTLRNRFTDEVVPALGVVDDDDDIVPFPMMRALTAPIVGASAERYGYMWSGTTPPPLAFTRLSVARVIQTIERELVHEPI
jgi:nitronate monooxygenase